MTGLPTPKCYRHSARETYISCQRCERPICPDCMRDAAVGFHCPSCVSAAAGATRSARAAYGGQRSANPALTTMVLIGMNVAVWLAIVASGWRSSPLIDRLALLPRGRCAVGSGYYPDVTNAAACRLRASTTWYDGVTDGAYWQLITSAFTHVELWHIATNLVSLWFVGPILEAALGPTRFLAVYFLSALSGSALVYWLSDMHGTTVGASGAGFGLIAALVLVAFKVGGDTRFAMRWLGLGVIFTIVFWQIISWQGHLGGVIGGFVVTGIILYAPPEKRTQVQAAGLGAFLVLLAISVLSRSAMLT